MARKYGDHPLEQRAYETGLTAAEEEGREIVGMPIVYGVPTTIRDFWGEEFIEVIAPGALDKTDLRDVRLFVNHDAGSVALARSKNGNGTMSLTPTPEGLTIRAKLDTENNPEAAALYSAVQRGDMDGMSFAFRVEADEWTGLDTDVPTRTIKAISIVHEVSVVNFPAYKATSVSARAEGGSPGESPLAEARRAAREETLALEREKNANRAKRY